MKAAGTNGDGANGIGTTAPVYLRLQKRAEKYGPRTRWHFASRRGVHWAGGILAVAAVIWVSSRWLETDPRFRLRSMELSGGQYVARSDVEDVFAADREQGLYRIPLPERRSAVEKVPWVHSATVTRVWPDQIWVSVQERVPIAFLSTRRGIMLVDAEGVLLETPPLSTFSLPVVRGVSEGESADRRRAKMQRFVALTDALGPRSGALPEQISEVDLADPEDARIVVTGSFGAVRLHLGAEEFADRYELFSSQIEQWWRQFGTIDSIDLRYEGQVVIQASIPVTLHLDTPSTSNSSRQNAPAVSPRPSL